MAAVSKIENGVVELRTDVGRLYVRPTGWQSLYLRWTFRNFHSLPQQILNRRQKRLIERLSRSALLTPAEPVPGSAIIGIVENMRVFGLPSLAEAAEPATKAKPAVAAEKVAVLHARAEDAVLEADARAPVERAPAEPAPVPEMVQEGPAPPPVFETEALPAPAPQTEPGRRGRRISWAVAPAGAAAVLLVLAFWLAPLWRMPQLAITPAPAPAAPPLTAALAPQPAVASAKPGLLRLSPARPAEAAGHPAANPPASVSAAVPDLPNLPQIAEAPRSGFIYPVAPNPNLVGKVALKAVVGSDGTVKEIEVLSGDRALAAAAVRAVKQWRYAPAQVGGRTVEAQTRVTISFLGDDAVSITVPESQ